LLYNRLNGPVVSPTPSDQNISVTQRLEQTAEGVGIPVIDRIVVGLTRQSAFRNGDPGIDGSADHEMERFAGVQQSGPGSFRQFLD